jgi:arylsulfatase A-like enzyme
MQWILVAVLALGLTGALGCSQRGPKAVFLIVIDSARPERLSAYGERLYRTPHVDSLAAGGVLFKRAVSTSTWSTPAVGAMLTSRYPTQLGLVEAPVANEAAVEWNQRREQTGYTLAPGETTLAEILRGAGYATAAFVNQPAINAGAGFCQGFDDYYYPRNDEGIVALEPGASPVQSDVPGILENALSLDNLLLDEFDRWLGQHRGEHAFAWIHVLTPHWPYLPPPWSDRRTARTKGRFERPKVSDHYDGELIAADELLGRIVNLIDARVGSDNAVVAVVSNHGEAFGEHGTTGHGHSLHGEVTRVPLILRAPDAPAGVRVEPVVSTIDLLPTLLDLAGAAGKAPKGIEGESLVPLFVPGAPQREAYSEGILYGTSRRSLIAGGKKAIWDGATGNVRVFDYLREPEEIVEIQASHPALADSLRGRLQALHRRLAADYAGSNRETADASPFDRILGAMGYPRAVGDSTGTRPGSEEPGHHHGH